MAVINLRNVVALGVLEDGVYPSVYNGQTGEYIGTVAVSYTHLRAHET